MRARSRSGPRRLEVVVLIDGTGASWAVGVLDTTLRLAGRVVLAESPPTGLTTELSRTLSATAVGLARPEGATGAATVSFSIDLVRGEPQYLGSTPGLPRELALLEATTGIDLEARALHLTRGGHLKGEPPEARGHALQIFLSARDPEAGFAVRPGEVEALRLPAGAGLRADPEVEEGGFPAAEDPVLVRLTAHGASRNEALDRLHRALARTTVTLTGGATDKAFLSEVLDRLAVGTEPADPAWVERLVDSGEHLPRRGAEAALLAAAIAECEAELDGARERFLATAARGRPEIPNEGSSRFELGYRGWRYAFKVGSLEPLLYRVEVDGQTFDIQVGPPGRNGRSLTVGRRRYAVRTDLQGGDLLVEADGVPHRIARDRGVVVRSPSPALIVSVEVGPGDEVAAGEPLAVLEAMKMETSLTAPFAGRVRRVEVLPNTRVGGGGPLLVLEPLAPDPEPPGRQGPRVRFEPAMPAIPAIPAISAMSAMPVISTAGAGETDSPGARQRAVLTEIRRLMLGYAFDARRVEAFIQAEKAGEVPDGDRATAELEAEILSIFADSATLSRRHPEGMIEGGRLSAFEYLSTYLRHLDAAAEGLPAAFLAALARALGHYGVSSLARSPALEEGLFRLLVAHRRAAYQVPAVLALLERSLRRSDRPAEADGEAQRRDLLDRLIAAAQGREPALYDLAREVRYRCFDRPLLLAVHEQAQAAAETDLVRLASRLDAA
ncbi:MAG TPA: biotin/lipoyl-containing protein, partial [Thermoanaerobaculia bacterium]|nr:biotin/lipoyl-containing protein [Thermoanaerobaculia bacterium]